MKTSHVEIKEPIHLVGTYMPQTWFFSSEAILCTAELLLDECKKAVKQICMALSPPQISLVSVQQCFHGFFGNLNEHHGIYPGDRLGFDATEPQITKGIASFLDPMNHSKLGEERTKTFLLALLEGKSQFEPLISSLLSGQPLSFTVEAEKLVPKANRRIDLFIGWNPIDSGKYKYGVLIEAKFGHKVTKGQLPDYKQYAKNLLLYEVNTALILLTLEGEPCRRNKDWSPVQWFSLMTRWEKQLNDSNRNFTYFRHFIWKKLGS